MNDQPASFGKLFQSISIGPLEMRNRIVIPGMSLGYLTGEGLLGRQYQAYLARRAAGGAALIGIGSSPVHPTSYKRTMEPHLWRDGVVDGLRRAADAVHDEGALLSIILWHGGRHITHRLGQAPVAPSQVASPDTGELPRAASLEDIRSIVDGYRSAAKACVAAGIDVIEVQTASDYLLGSFLNPHTNLREDEYGGSAEARRRIVVEVLEAVRGEAAATTAVGIRTSAEHLIPNDPDAYGPDDSLEHVSALAELGLVDYVSLMTGSHYYFPGMISPIDVDNARLLGHAARFRAALPVPVTVTGNVRSPHDAARIIEDGIADLVGVARAHLADPDWTRKTANGNSDAIRPCIDCNQACIGNAFRSLPATCIVNPVTGRESELPATVGESASPGRVAIVGAGPAGLEAARIAALRGHEVDVYEARDEAGGAMRIAALAPGRGQLGEPLEWWLRELRRLGVRLHFDHRISDISTVDAQHVVWAIGGRPGFAMIGRHRPQLVNGIPGTENAMHSRDLIENPADLGGRVLVIDEEGGWPAVSTVETIAVQPGVDSVVVATDRAIFGDPDLGPTLEHGVVASRLAKLPVEIHAQTLIDRVEDARAITMAGDVMGPFDQVVLSTGAVSNEVPQGAIGIGDCLAPRSIWAAVSEGMEAALAL